MIKGAIFDMDGVVLDSMIMWHNFGARYIESKGIKPPEGLNTILFSTSMEQGIEYVIEHFLPDMTLEEIMQDYTDILNDFYYNKVELKDGARELLEDLDSRGIPMVVATSSPKGQIDAALRRNGVRDFFREIYTTTEVGRSKYEPHIYMMAAHTLGTSPRETLVFEDSLYALKTAADAGFITVGMHDPRGEVDQEGLRATADLYMTSLRDFSLEALHTE